MVRGEAQGVRFEEVRGALGTASEDAVRQRGGGVFQFGVCWDVAVAAFHARLAFILRARFHKLAPRE